MGGEVTATHPICVAGAGSIGCFVGGMLAAAGRDVSLLARPRVVESIRIHGLRLTAVGGLDKSLTTAQLRLSDDPRLFEAAGIILVTVKSGDTEEIAELIARHAPADALIVSLQNGVGNVAELRKRLPGHRVLGGMVPFNVVTRNDGHVHRATSGDIIIERDASDTAAMLSVPDLTMRPTDDIAGVQWGKLLVNLNNALNALSDMPLRSQLAQRAWRKLFADQMAEGLAVLKAMGVKPVSSTPIPVGMTPHILRLPDVLFKVLLVRTMRIDADARSSMWEDLQRGRRTEIDYLQGVILGLAAEYGIKTPLTGRIMALIKESERSGAGLPALSPLQIRSE
jgi:2-dehydropantoate 2-reductase